MRKQVIFAQVPLPESEIDKVELNKIIEKWRKTVEDDYYVICLPTMNDIKLTIL